ncbi:hypothetical protein KUM39_10530 [Streptomyces sp. J2-1]|uniref:hypothetical protein n=1 Tax=Streptomyces corallincola TaxID=2851888 RepID=UPI001C38DECC|nr:hypothetical protein [Streptomyces corallincola]MBV2354796.1 hypothetical protein [Streptomyces corallincola]
MHMNSVPQHLLNEDRQEFERLLDEALRSAPHRPELAAVGQRLDSAQLRAMALSATTLITSAASAEYQHYVKVRTDLRQPAPATAPATAEPGPGTDSGSDAAYGPAGTDGGVLGLAATLGAAPAPAGAGAVAVVAVLAPVLAGAAAAIFLLVGYVLRAVAPQQAFARSMLTAGWVFGAIAAAAILLAGAGLLITALRNGPSARAAVHDRASEEVARARDAWRDALLERGILPFLRDALADPGTGAPHRSGPESPATGRMPRLGYGRPGFSSPDDGAEPDRPRFSSPDYSSPDFGGPEHQPD